jgi:mRNA interferase RelE/StbE
VASRRYRIEFAPAADRVFRGLAEDVRRRLRPPIDALAGNPRPHGAESLAGEKGLHRIMASDSRIMYQIRDNALVVLIVRVGHRREGHRKA